jgi:starch-binding outer membrane protein, SusD/RagB family
MMKYIIVLLLAISVWGCTKFVQVAPPNSELVGTTVYSSDATAEAGVTGIYAAMQTGPVGGGPNGISISAGLSADEITLVPNSGALLGQLYTNALLSTNAPGFWYSFYNYLYQANYAMEGINSSTGMTAATKTRLTAECKFIRAFCLFYLTDFYGDAPVVTSSNYVANEVLAKTPQAQVYQQIISDLLSAQGVLSDTYSAPDGSQTTQRLRPNQNTVTALLARVYLYEQKWDSAAIEASQVISDGQYNLYQNLDSVFLPTSAEAIWQLQPQDNGWNTSDGSAFVAGLIGIPPGPGQNAEFYLSNSVVQSFEAGDTRKVDWVDSVIVSGQVYYYPYKYKLYYTGTPPTEYVTVFRLAEQYLIRAEAEAYGAGNGTAGAVADLNTIRNRAGLPGYSGPADQASLVNAILKERRVELFTEFGHRWFDLQRTGNVDSVMGPACALKGGTWSSYDALYPIPYTEILYDTKLVQNSGYN